MVLVHLLLLRQTLLLQTILAPASLHPVLDAHVDVNAGWNCFQAAERHWQLVQHFLQFPFSSLLVVPRPGRQSGQTQKAQFLLAL